MSTDTALKTFSLENDILQVSPQDEIYRYDREADRQLNREEPWKKECVLPALSSHTSNSQGA
jgi:COP9 signalosome complex subunit 5